MGPVDRGYPARSSPRPGPGRRLLRHWHLLAGAAGMLAAGAGVAFQATQSEYQVSLTTDSYRIGEVRLAAQGAGSYAGPGGALVIVHVPGGIRAAGATNVHGVHATGQCALTDHADHESCLFVLGANTISATDTLTSYGWSRRYGDGVQVRIRIEPPGLTPVPFPLGR